MRNAPRPAQAFELLMIKLTELTAAESITRSDVEVLLRFFDRLKQRRDQLQHTQRGTLEQD